MRNLVRVCSIFLKLYRPQTKLPLFGLPCTCIASCHKASSTTSDVKSSRPKWPKFWPRPRPRGFGLGLASISLSYYVIGHFSCKNRVEFGNFVNFSGNNLKSYVVNHYVVLFRNYFWPWRCLGLGLGLEILASLSVYNWQPKWCKRLCVCSH